MTKSEWKAVTGRDAERLYTVMCKRADEKNYWAHKTFDDFAKAKAFKDKCLETARLYYQINCFTYRIVDDNGIICG